MATCKTLFGLTQSLDTMQNATTAEKKPTPIKETKTDFLGGKQKKIAITVKVDEATFNEWQTFFKAHGYDKASGIRKAVREFIKDVNNGRKFDI